MRDSVTDAAVVCRATLARKGPSIVQWIPFHIPVLSIERFAICLQNSIKDHAGSSYEYFSLFCK